MKKIGTRIMLILIGIAFIFYGMAATILGYWGEKSVGQIYVVRRELGERNDPTPNRYSYSVGYKFAAGGKTVYGNTKRIGSANNAGISKGITTVKYLKEAPFINFLAADTGISWGNAIIAGAGVLLLVVGIFKVN